MQAVWIIYEWGKDNYTETNPNVDRAFYFIMSIALVSNVFLALYGCFCWMLSVIIDSSNEDFVFQSRKMLTLLQNMLMFTGNFVFLGLLLGIYKNLSPNLPETIITLVVAVSMRILGDKYWGRQISICMPLEYYHFPRYIQIMMGFITKAQRDELKGRAKIRAEKLRKKAYQERRKLDPGFRDETNTSSIPTLLRTAAINLGRNDLDVTIYEERLEEDLFNDPVHLKGRSVECLSRYMPLRLAEEVYRLLVDTTEEEVQYDCS